MPTTTYSSSAVLDAEPDLEVVAEAEDGLQAIERAQRTDVHLAILDISMPRMTGLQATYELLRHVPGIRILILSMHDNEQYLFEALASRRVRICAQVRRTGISSRRAGRRCAASRPVSQGVRRTHRRLPGARGERRTSAD